ncbi:MAG: mono/diheme cytochrome c family protein [Rhodothermales bacterium]|jgi:mono/diheme cytochrome c family protein
MSNRTGTPLLAAFIATLVIFAGCRQQNKLEPVADASNAVKGQQLFEQFCQKCHGVDGSGNGPIAELLKVPPTDLSILTVDNGGSFPSDRISAWIDGREETRSHGTREMPVWGNIWTDEAGGTEVEQEVAEHISQIVEHIRWLQVPSEVRSELDTQ